MHGSHKGMGKVPTLTAILEVQSPMGFLSIDREEGLLEMKFPKAEIHRLTQCAIGNQIGQS